MLLLSYVLRKEENKKRRAVRAHSKNVLCYLRNAYKILVEKPDGKRPLGRRRRRWEDNIRMALRKTGCEGVD
jgi:hypothetical protein